MKRSASLRIAIALAVLVPTAWAVPAFASVIPPSITTTANPTDAVFTPPFLLLQDSASLAGGSSPTGTITFSLFNNGTGTGSPLATQILVVTGDGLYTSDHFTVVSAGLYSWSVSYSGDSNNVSTTAPLEVVTLTAPSVPEPATLALLGLGLTGLALTRRRKSH